MKLSNLLQKEFKIIEKKKIFFLIPVIIVVLAIIAGIIYGFVLKSPFNLGMDFTGGYSIQVNLSSKLNADNYNDYVKEIETIFEDLKDDSGNDYGVRVASTQLQGEDTSASINIRYQAVTRAGFTSDEIETLMEDEINVKLKSELQKLFKITPVVTVESGVIKAVYSEVISEPNFETIKSKVSSQYSVNADDIKLDSTKKIVTVPASAGNNLDAIRDTMSIGDVHSGQAVDGNTVSATISGELLTDAILAVCAAIVMMLIYIVFRFELSSGVAAIIGSLHDILVMFAFMVILRIEINATFIASLITILGYSINNTIIIFDRIRENSKMLKNKNMGANWLANTSVRETLMRSINTTITTLITITMVAIIGVPSIQIFALPIIIGLIAGTYSSIFISPAVWASWKNAVAKKEKKDVKGSNVSTTISQ